MAQGTTTIESVWAAKGNLPDNAIVATADGKYPALDGSLITNVDAGDLLAANNLSELTATASVARTNLGLGTAATTASTDYADAVHASRHSTGGADPITADSIDAARGSSTQTSFASARPVGTAIYHTSNPSSPVTQSTDFHGIDVVQLSAGSNMDNSSFPVRLYPLESTARHNTNGDISLSVPMYSLWSNTANGNIDGVRGLRMWGKNQGTGTVADAQFISIASPENSGGGSITGLRGIKMELMSDTFADAKGIDIAEPNNYIAGLEVGDTEVEPAIYRQATEGVRLEADSSFAISGGLNLGRGDLTLSRVLTFDDYTPASNAEIFATHSTGNERLQLTLLTTGVWRLTFTDSAAATTNYDITPSSAFTAATEYRVTLAVDRDGNASLYADGKLVGSVDVSGSSEVDLGEGNANDTTFYADSNVSVIDRGGVLFNYLLDAATITARTKSACFRIDGDEWGGLSGATEKSDWSSGSDGWVTTNCTAANNQTVDSVTAARTLTINGTTGTHYSVHTSIFPASTTDVYVIQCRIYVPSTNSLVDGIKFGFNAGVSSADNFTPTPDTWFDVSFEQSIDSGWLPRMYIWFLDGTSTTIAGNSTDTITIKDLRITPKGAVLEQSLNDGLGATLHDASSNELDATITGSYAHLTPKTSCRLRTVPATAGATGVIGQWAAETGFRYDCIAADTWERVAIATW